MTIEKKPLQRLVTISVDAAGKVSHAWQVTTYSIVEDGTEISRQHGGQENIEPAALAAAIPDQAELLQQIEAERAEARQREEALSTENAALRQELKTVRAAHTEAAGRVTKAMQALRAK